MISETQKEKYSTHIETYRTAYNKAKDYANNAKLTDAVKSPFQSAITTYASVNYTNVETAITALNALDYTEADKQIKAYDDNIDAYNTAKSAAEKLKDNPLISDDIKTQLTNALATSVNGANIVEVLATLNAAVEAGRSALNAQLPYDASGKIVNPEAENEKNGWTGEFGILGDDGAHFFEPAGWWKTSASMSQTVSGLPNGYYVLQMKYQAAEHVKVTLAGNTATNYVQGTNEGWKDMGVVCKVTDGTLAITTSSIATDGETQYTWFNADNFTLTYYGDADPGLTYNNGTRLDGSYLSKPAYTSTPMEGVDDAHKDDALLVITWRDNYTNDPKTPWALAADSKAEVWVDGAKVADADLLSDFRSSHYTNGFGLYIPNFDETKTYTVKVPANVFGYTQAGHGNKAFEVQAVASPLKDGKYFVVVKGTGKHVSRGKGWGTQAILDYYGVPMMVQTAGLTVFKFLDNNAFLGSDPSDDWLFTDIQGSEAHKVRRYILMPGEGEHEGEFQFYTPARDKYLSHVSNYINSEEYDAVNEGGNADYFQFEALTAEEYAEHLKSIRDDEAMRVAQRTGMMVNNAEEYFAKITELEASIKDSEGNVKNENIIFPKTEEEKTLAAKYFEKKNEELACAADVWEGTPRDLVGEEKVKRSLKAGMYIMNCDAFQQAMTLSTLQANQGFRGLTYMYVKVGDVMYKSQLKSITETTGTIPTDVESATAALDAHTYQNRILFYVPTDDTEVEFGIENPQRLGNGIDAEAGSWVAFKNIEIEQLSSALEEANMSVKAGKYGTFIAPFDVKMPAGVTAYSGTLNEEKTSVSLTSVAEPGSTLSASTPVIIYNESEKDFAMDYRDFDTRSEADKAAVSKQVGHLVGFYKSYAEDNSALITGDGNSYVLQTQNGKQAFYQVESGKTFNGSKNRCYLVTSQPSSVKVYELTFDTFDTETAIQEVESEPSNDVIFDLSGRMVSKVNKGLYIKNGKKFIVK